MSTRNRDALGDKSLALVFIAGSIREAERAEAALTASGIDYCFDSEEFAQGILLSPRTGVGFYVIEGQAPSARHQLAKAELQPGVIDTDA
jgi:hypothetical protein